MNTTTDRIEKRVLLRAPRDRVWRAISDAKEFGSWFGAEIDGQFVAGAHLTARIVPTTVDADVARTQEAYRGMAFECWIERIEPMRLFSFRWHPSPIEPNVDLSNEPTTLVEFALEEVAGGTQLTITESGFAQLPIERRAKAFAGNAEGWEAQARLIAKYLAAAS